MNTGERQRERQQTITQQPSDEADLATLRHRLAVLEANESWTRMIAICSLLIAVLLPMVVFFALGGK